MLLGGLWHGVSWHYVLWGAYQGCGLVVSHAWTNVSSKMPALARAKESKLFDLGARALTLLAVMIGWVMFRADSLPQAAGVYLAMFTPHASADVIDNITIMLLHSVVPVALLLYCLYHLAKRISVKAQEPSTEAGPSFWLTPPSRLRALAAVGLALLIVGFAPHKAIPFI
jgi:alginate O-acetyltransferase complex protein AlgI